MKGSLPLPLPREPRTSLSASPARCYSNAEPLVTAVTIAQISGSRVGKNKPKIVGRAEPSPRWHAGFACISVCACAAPVPARADPAKEPESSPWHSASPKNSAGFIPLGCSSSVEPWSWRWPPKVTAPWLRAAPSPSWRNCPHLHGDRGHGWSWGGMDTRPKCRETGR